MTKMQKEQLYEMRKTGKSYSDIGLLLGIKESTVRTFCSRNGLTGEALANNKTEDNKSVCPNCGLPITQKQKQKPRRFCSDKCRLEWWKKNRSEYKHNAYYKAHCEFCGKEFISYGNKGRKYCCHECYINGRFGTGKEVSVREEI